MMGSFNRQKAKGAAGFFQFSTLKAVAIQGLLDVAQYRPKFEGAVIAFAIGIAAYFSAPFEPQLWMCALASVILAGLYWRQNQQMQEFAGCIFCLLIFTLGFGRAVHHSRAVDAPIMPTYERSYDLAGWIAGIDRSGTGLRYHIELESLRGVDANKMPRAVRVRLARPPETPLRAGDRLSIRAIIKAPPGPVVPNGYDPARRAYFDGFGGFGFAISEPEKQPDIDLKPMINIKRKITRWRYGLASHIHNVAPAHTAGLQAALMTGVRLYIPPEQTENLRVAGLAHILAISGLHMGLLAGGTYAAVTFILALITPLSRRYDIRKLAAMIGALTATFYLVLSGASVATQRAFIMAIIVFLAVILDRRAISMRSVAVAAFLTLLFHPESLVSVGFQMSFAAVAALVVTYQTWQNYRPVYKKRGRGRRFVDFFTSLSVTSFVAGLATGGFAIFHFNRISRYGFIGNLLAMPFFSLAVMPLAVVSFIAMLFGLERLPLQMMGFAISYILTAANWVASWPNAMAYVPSAPSYVLSVFAISFVAICLGRLKGRIAGLALMLICIGIWARTPQPDLRISEDGRIAFWLKAREGSLKSPVLMVDAKRADRYGREQFAQMAGRPKSVWVDYAKSFADCDALACRFELRGKIVSVLKHPSEVITECAEVDLAILTVREAGPVARRRCEMQGRALFVDEHILHQSGALNVYLGKKNHGQNHAENHKTANRTTEKQGHPRESIYLEPSRTQARAQRPWGR